MDLVEDNFELDSTLRFYEEHDFDPSLTSSTPIDQEAANSYWSALEEASSKREQADSLISEASEMDLVEAAQSRGYYDMIVLLVNHCEKCSEGEEPSDQDALTFRGVGQALGLNRRTSNFLNSETRLMPDLVVMPPRRHAIETAMHAFSHYSPHSVRAVQWVCLPEAEVPHEESLEASAATALERSQSMIDWLKDREEKVVVVTSDNTWLQGFGFATQYSSNSSSAFRDGELRAVGINFK